MTVPLLSVRDLRTWFHTSSGIARAVDGVSFDVMPHETVGVVGESGCGKSVTSLSILRLIDRPGAIEPPRTRASDLLIGTIALLPMAIAVGRKAKTDLQKKDDLKKTA
jgi:ABC-type dipeptide/oligopeptide/nickel transport system ATPase component